MTDIKANTVAHGSMEIVNESKRKLNELRVSQGRKFYNKLMQKVMIFQYTQLIMKVSQ